MDDHIVRGKVVKRNPINLKPNENKEVVAVGLKSVYHDHHCEVQIFKEGGRLNVFLCGLYLIGM